MGPGLASSPMFASDKQGPQEVRDDCVRLIELLQREIDRHHNFDERNEFCVGCGPWGECRLRPQLQAIKSRIA